jgi:hypothetical protein
MKPAGFTFEYGLGSILLPFQVDLQQMAGGDLAVRQTERVDQKVLRTRAPAR